MDRPCAFYFGNRISEAMRIKVYKRHGRHSDRHGFELLTGER